MSDILLCLSVCFPLLPLFEVQVVQFHLPDRRLCVQEIELTKRSEDTAICFLRFG